MNRKLYFAADEGVHGAEPWKVYQGRVRFVADIRPGPAGSALLNLGYGQDADDVFFRSGGYVFFATREDITSQRSALWTMKTGSYCPEP